MTRTEFGRTGRPHSPPFPRTPVSRERSTGGSYAAVVWPRLFMGRLLLSLSFLAVCAVWLVPLHAAPRRDVRGSVTINHWTRYSRTLLQFEKTLYDPGERIPVRFRVENRGYEMIRLYPSLEPGKTFQFMVTDPGGREIPVVDGRAIRSEGVKEVVDRNGERVKEILLHPGESFEHVLDLNDYYDLKPGREYRVTGYYYPDARYNFFTRSENTVRIRIHNRRYDPYWRMEESDPRTDSLPGLTPEETVYLFLSSEMRKNWKNYLKYLDLKKYITSYDSFSSRFAAASPEERPVVLRRFSRYLTENPTDQLKRFEIVKTEPERGQGGESLPGGRMYVTARALRESNGYSVKYEYTYTLESTEPEREGFWKITHVVAHIVE